jgi:thiol-disulfide isomerase/thioredoxin
MTRKYIIVSILTLSIALLTACQGDSKAVDGFVIRGELPLPDGYHVGLCLHTDTAFSVSVDEDTVMDGHFILTGKLDKPYKGTLMTNNLALVEKNHWPDDSIRWTYTDVFVSNGELSFTGQDENTFKLTGTQVQKDYNDLLAMGGEQKADLWQFIDEHPESVISVWLACQLTDRAYTLTAEEVDHLQQTVKGSPVDTTRFALLQKKLETYRLTVKDAPLTNLELVSCSGDTCQLKEVLPKNGKMVLIDFWASWCGICIHSMPEIAKLAAQNQDRFCVMAVSIDTKEDAWQHAMKQHPEPWPQYRTTAKGYQDLFDKYQVGNGVPYYLLVSSEGRVICCPEGPEEIGEILNNNINK